MRYMIFMKLGHAQDIGHPSPDNIMGLISDRIVGLQAGYIKGIRQIYGE